MDLEVDLHTFVSAHLDGAFLIDVREPFEHAGGHVAGASLIPLGALPQRVAAVPIDRPVFVICASGNRSLTAARWLGERGVDARSVVGGMSAWMSSGYPVVRSGVDDVA